VLDSGGDDVAESLDGVTDHLRRPPGHPRASGDAPRRAARRRARTGMKTTSQPRPGDAATVTRQFNAAWIDHDLAAALVLTSDDCVFDRLSPGWLPALSTTKIALHPRIGCSVLWHVPAITRPRVPPRRAGQGAAIQDRR